MTLFTNHSMYTEVLSENTLKFNFDNIYLPDSMSNEPASHGYLIFEISPQIGLTEGTIIENTSEIYFDFNSAIVTNTVSNILVNSIPNCSSNIGITQLHQKDEIRIYPNPTYSKLTIDSNGQTIKSIKILDLRGKIIKVLSSHLQSISVAELPTGIYFIQLQINDKINTQKFIKQ